MESAVKANAPSDPYLLTGFDRKDLLLAHDAGASVTFTLEIDLTGTGVWFPYATYAVPAGKPFRQDVSQTQGYWLRFRVSADCVATAQLNYT